MLLSSFSAINDLSVILSDLALALFTLQPLSLDDLIKKKNEQETLAKVYSFHVISILSIYAKSCGQYERIREHFYGFSEMTPFKL